MGKRVIRNYDVASLYPSLMINCGYTSRNIPSAADYEEVYRNRVHAKKLGNKTTASALKLVLNTTYGAMLNPYNPLYDPLMGRSVCISGQLFLTELVMMYLRKCKSIRIINFNTDGVLFSIDEEEMPLIYAANKEWQARTGFALEEEKIRKVVQKDVNNYLIVTMDGQVKTKGGYLVHGVQDGGGAWNINNTAVVVKKAIVDYFVRGSPPEQTIGNCNNIFEFQFIAKAGSKYREAYHLVDGQPQAIQKVNRVYASRDTRYGTLYKIKSVDDSEAKIESLPKHCIIDNDNRLSITDIDKQFYIDMAYKRIADFLGDQPIKNTTLKEGEEKAMATAGKGILTKLQVLQEEMASHAWEKDGINRHQSYKYVTEKQYKQVFKAALRKAGLLWKMETLSHEFIPSVSDKMHLVICQFKGQIIDPATGEREEYLFVGSGADNGDKAIYKAVTGGHKFFLAGNFNVAEGNDPEGEEAPKPVYTSPEKREEIKETVINKEGPATQMQIASLKKALKRLREVDENQEELIGKLAEKTANFTNVSRELCEVLILKLTELTDAAVAKK